MARHKDFVPEDVIEKSIDVFLAKGYEATAIKDIVDATNVHPGSLYNEFGSKKEIYKQALEHFLKISKFNLNLANAEIAPPRATIEKLFFDLIDSTSERGSVGHCLISKAAMEIGGVDEEITAWLKVVFKKSESLLSRLIERGQAAGEITSSRPPQELAQFLGSTVQGMQVMARFERDKKKFRAIAKIALATLDQTD
ncbi:MAG: TetR/AcrR family transcriptional regulator [Rhodospirillales bacterium]|nr:TetR/AcrR family transcriptional regulator [Rhodospirillales bacterium]